MSAAVLPYEVQKGTRQRSRHQQHRQEMIGDHPSDAGLPVFEAAFRLVGADRGGIQDHEFRAFRAYRFVLQDEVFPALDLMPSRAHHDRHAPIRLHPRNVGQEVFLVIWVNCQTFAREQAAQDHWFALHEGVGYDTVVQFSVAVEKAEHLSPLEAAGISALTENLERSADADRRAAQGLSFDCQTILGHRVGPVADIGGAGIVWLRRAVDGLAQSLVVLPFRQGVRRVPTLRRLPRLTCRRLRGERHRVDDRRLCSRFPQGVLRRRPRI